MGVANTHARQLGGDMYRLYNNAVRDQQDGARWTTIAQEFVYRMTADIDREAAALDVPVDELREVLVDANTRLACSPSAADATERLNRYFATLWYR